MHAQPEVTPRQGLTGLAKGVHSRAARDQHRLPGRTAVMHALEPAFPVPHLVDFVKHQQWGALAPALRLNYRPVRCHVEIQVLPARRIVDQLPAQGGFSDLTRARQNDKLLLEVIANLLIDIAFHATTLYLNE